MINVIITIVLVLVILAICVGFYYFGRFEGKTLAEMDSLNKAREENLKAMKSYQDAHKFYEDTTIMIENWRRELKIRCEDNLKAVKRISSLSETRLD